MNLYQVTGPVIGIGGIIVKANNPKQASHIARDVISESQMAIEDDDTAITLYVRELVEPEYGEFGYCYPKTAENIYQITLD